jgi:hypothetical protein
MFDFCKLNVYQKAKAFCILMHMEKPVTLTTFRWKIFIIICRN